MSTQIETRRDAAQPQESPSESLASYGLVHLAACCGAAGAALLTVILTGWLT